MQIPRRYIENYSNSLNQISDTARESLSKALMRLDYDADIADIRNAVIAVMQTFCGASTDMSARLAAEFYDGLRLQFGIDDGYQAEVDSGRVPEATDGAVRAFVQDLVDDKPIEQFVGKCVDRLDYETRKAANECVAKNAKNDPEKPRWARVPTGVETCSFCIMLASRGFVYHSEETASHAHAHCDCRVVPSWDKSPLAQGYDPDKYYDMWKHPEKYASDEENKKDKSQGISFNLEGVVKSSNTERTINRLKSLYESPLIAVQPMLPGQHYATHASTDVCTGLVISLRKGDDITVAHEYAHSMWNSKRLKEYQIEGHEQFGKEIRKLYRKYKNDDSLEALISMYSLENVDEFLAEAFAAYVTGQNPDRTGNGIRSPYVKLVGELVDKYFKKR